MAPGLDRRHFICTGLAGCALPLRAEPIDVIAATKPSVAAVGTFRATDNPRFTFRGTGFVVGNGNQLVTNAHVLPPPGDPAADAMLVMQIPRPGGLEARALSVVSVVRANDLALLRFEGAPLPALPLAQPEQIQEGLAVVFIGFPIGGALGFRPVSHRGMISSITPIASPAANSQQLNNQAIAQLRRGSFDIYQLDATAYPGNSGGPVLDATTGKVVGVINMVFIKGAKESALTNPSGISYALPVRLVQELLKGP
jgi:S1-C subfamily serine protease